MYRGFTPGRLGALDAVHLLYFEFYDKFASTYNSSFAKKINLLVQICELCLILESKMSCHKTAFQSKAHRLLAERKSQLVHPGGGGTPAGPSGGPLPCSLPGVPLSYSLLGSHVTYPIMLLYTTLECPCASCTKIHMDPPPPELDRQTDRQTRLKKLPSRTTCAGGKKKTAI